MGQLTIFKSRTPTSMRIFEHGVEVAEVNKRYRNAKKFARRRRRRLYLERVRNLETDPKAIRVVGKSKGWFLEKRKCIGYVPGDIAQKLVFTATEGKVTARLQMISIDDSHSIEIRFDILGPKEDYEKYSSKYYV
jgi:hypothetical protein